MKFRIFGSVLVVIGYLYAFFLLVPMLNLPSDGAVIAGFIGLLLNVASALWLLKLIWKKRNKNGITKV